MSTRSGASSGLQSGKLLASVVRATSYNIVLQLLFRLSTFFLNAFVLRYITRELLGIVNVRLTLLYTTVLFLSREGFRKSCLSQLDSSKVTWRDRINILWGSPVVGVSCAVVFGLSWSKAFHAPDAVSTPYYHSAVITFALCAVAETLAEPLWVIGQKFMFVRTKVVIESVAMAVRCLVTVVVVVYFPQSGLIGFSVAQASFSVVYVGAYYAYFAWYAASSQKKDDDFPLQSITDALPFTEGEDNPLVSPTMASLTVSFLKQSLLKQALTEGERYVMTIFNVLTFSEQGVYDVINNLGSLVARFLFQPVEENAYLFFSQILTRGKPLNEHDKETQELAGSVLRLLLRLVSLVSLIMLAFGLPFSELALDLYGGEILSKGIGPNLLRFYCGYVLLLALNGITECFYFAVMKQDAVDRYNWKLLQFSAAFLVSSLFLTWMFGSVGFILANSFNMAIRIAHSVTMIRSEFGGSLVQSPLSGIVPSWPVLVALASSWAVTTVSELSFCCDQGVKQSALHIAVGTGCLSITLLVILMSEKEAVAFLRRALFSTKEAKLKAS